VHSRLETVQLCLHLPIVCAASPITEISVPCSATATWHLLKLQAQTYHPHSKSGTFLPQHFFRPPSAPSLLPVRILVPCHSVKHVQLVNPNPTGITCKDSLIDEGCLHCPVMVPSSGGSCQRKRYYCWFACQAMHSLDPFIILQEGPLLKALSLHVWHGCKAVFDRTIHVGYCSQQQVAISMIVPHMHVPYVLLREQHE
jgi:hypothetical protein